MDDRLFLYLISRIQTREISTHTVAVISSSASLILFVFYFSNANDEFSIRLLGIVLPIIGFAYFEVVFGTQQRWDFQNIREFVNKESTLPKKRLMK